jgi:hypothetical protein
MIVLFTWGTLGDDAISYPQAIYDVGHWGMRLRRGSLRKECMDTNYYQIYESHCCDQ